MIDSLGNFDDVPAIRWHDLASRVLDGYRLTADEALAIISSPDEQLLDLLSAVYRVRRRYFGNRVQLYFLMNAKSGLCPEDCGYCSQSKVSKADIPKYNLLNVEKILEGAKLAIECQAKTYCIVISARGPSENEMDTMDQLIPQIKEKYDVKICVSLGLLTKDQALRLKRSGVDRVNHNLNTSQQFYNEICSTHSFQDRIDTLRVVREAGLELCSGGIVGMGEKHEDMVQMAFALRELKAESIPINFLKPIEGTPLEGKHELNPRHCLRVLAMFRMVNPESEIRIAAGREEHLGSLQAMGLYAANSLFVGDYLTTKGQLPQQDYRMIEELGFQIAYEDEPIETELADAGASDRYADSSGGRS